MEKDGTYTVMAGSYSETITLSGYLYGADGGFGGGMPGGDPGQMPAGNSGDFPSGGPGGMHPPF